MNSTRQGVRYLFPIFIVTLFWFCSPSETLVGPTEDTGLTGNDTGHVDEWDTAFDFSHPDVQGDAQGPLCGNGIIDPNEACDEGELNGTLGHCNLNCTLPTFPPAPYPSNSVNPEWVNNPPACTKDDLFVKYLWYRLRFLGNGSAAFPGFIVSGTEPGMGIPASFRQPAVDCTEDWSMSGCTKKPGKGRYDWGDATIWLGEWIAVLATEYAAFKQIGLSTASTEESLYYALNAFNRVDEAAEITYGIEPKRDGFFLRDDVPASLAHLADDSQRFPGYSCLTSTISCGEPDISGGNYVSQDQIMGMHHGLAMVYSLIPDGVAYKGMEFRKEAQEMIHRMVKHIRDNNWRITDPNGNHPPDQWGGNAIAYSNKQAQLANKVCGNTFGVEDYRDILSQTEGELAFMGLLLIWDYTHAYNRTMTFRVMATINEWSADEITEKAVADSKDHFALMHALNNNTEVGKALSLWRIHSLLSTAPCGGPCHEVANCEETDGWKGDSRLIAPKDRMGSRHWTRAEFNGLDYMLLHNLYLVYQKGVYDYQPPAQLVECENYPTLKEYLETGEFLNNAYDPQNSCTATDMEQRFCGRTWASWLVDAYQGKATIFTGDKRWNCQQGQACQLEDASGEGTEGIDLYLGTQGDDSFDGLAGDDCIYGFDGNDTLYGGPGNDEIHGGPGADLIYGEEGHDVLYGDEGDDTIYGGPGRDEIYGGDGNDRLYGEEEDDFMNGGEGNDIMYGGPGLDVLLGGPGDDTLFGEEGEDMLYGGDGNDRIDGGDADDFIVGGKGDYNLLRGGSGDDSFVAEGSHDIVCGNIGNDNIWGAWTSTQKCLGTGSFEYGTDVMNGNSCVDKTATDFECSTTYFDYWTPP